MLSKNNGISNSNKADIIIRSIGKFVRSLPGDVGCTEMYFNTFSRKVAKGHR